MQRFLSKTLLLFMLLVSVTAVAQTEKNTIEAFTSSFEKKQGFFTFYHDKADAQFYLQIPKKGHPFIFQTSLPWGLGSNDIGLDRGQLGETRLASFLIEGDKALLLQHNTQFRAQTSNPAEKNSVDQAFADAVLYGFDVVASNEEFVLIDYTPYLLSDVHGVSERLQQTSQGQFKADTSRSIIYPERSKAFINNTELEAKVTFVGNGEGQWVNQVAANADALSLHLHHSFIKLPDTDYQPRDFHPNSGFWAHSFKDYAAPLGESMLVQYIPRHRLNKKDPIASLSQAREPIVYYLDPGAPEPVKTALLEGARWWSEGFEALGYENAFQVKVLPENADPMDVRYNVIQWVHRATRGWSYGSSVIDPRSGEIIKGHVTLGSLRVRQDMKIAEGLLTPFIEDASERKEAVKAMALARIRQLSAHEVGHTLGIAHNFAASTSGRASVMDYPHPLVSLTTDGSLNLTNAYTEGLGLWDKQVLAYGYSDFGGMPSSADQLNRILAKNKSLNLSFISDQDARPAGGAHPFAHLWDNGSDPVTELERLLSVRQQVLENFSKDMLEPQQPLSQLQAIFVPIYLLHRYQTEAAVKWLGGVNYRYYMAQDATDDYQPVSAARQQAALKQLLKTIQAETLRVPAHIKQWLVPMAYGQSSSREYFDGKTGVIPDTVSMAASAADHSLQLMLNPQRLNRLIQQHANNERVPSASQLMSELFTTVFIDWKQAKGEPLQQRLLATVINAEIRAIENSALAVEARLIMQAELVKQQRQLAESDSLLVQQLANDINTFLTDGEWPEQYEPEPLPPGSPI
ncbi:zinc-dependent metalloprotease [Idiomarina sp. HP20-50]|uniref:zinc-dependent metalloprotease n=1 Tax=Idiomarina sp. HP20-50 TaxID=3070813 RepID=UPI00294B7F6E|nr:zinc-dependent metalloprotease [Idiomarina sp. HP20-50]MDV6316852.1 zinc-dependent metalloprotease [Idiomarina sp. HP20-50]